MFPLYDQTRRRICLAGFVVLCLVPTAGVLAWCAWRNRPGHVGAEARRLSRELGLAVALGGVHHPRPGVVLYQGLELADPETGQRVLRCRVLEAQWNEIPDEQRRPRSTLVLVAYQPEIEAAAWHGLEQLFGRILQRQTGRPEIHVRLRAGELTLRAGESSQTLTELQGGLQALDGGTQAQLSFRLAGVDVPEPVRIHVARNRQTTPPVTSFALDTGGSAVPCGLLGMGLAGLEQLGPRSQFRGILWASQSFAGQRPDGWNGEVTGQLIDVDLGRLVTGRFPHRLSGSGLVTIQSARFQRGRLEAATATVDFGPGVISRSLLRAAVEQLHLIEGAEPAAPGELVPYEQLALAVILDPQGLQLQGRCRAAGLGAILVDRRSRLLSQPVFQPQPVVALLQALVPASEVQVPATRQTDWLMRHLPVPQVIRPEEAKSALPHARLRLGRAAGG